MEEELLPEPDSLEKKELLTVRQFVLLCLLSFNLYIVWWMYSSWRFFKFRQDYSIQAALRTLIVPVYLYGLFRRIRLFAAENSYASDYSPVLLFVGAILLSSLSALPEPLWLLSLLTLVCYIPPFKALNHGIEQCKDYETTRQTGFTTGQTIVLVVGGIFWILIIIAFIFVRK
ncbi:MAG TPA: hypothetical protein VJ508_07490 [Saprospiraceae bacterium]|nr:hypothetical protein [Saprospiraceae bacterium]